MKLQLINPITVMLLLATQISCTDKGESQPSASDPSDQAIFPIGESGPATNFAGNAYNFGLVANDSIYNTLVGNVYFEKNFRARKDQPTHSSFH